MKFLFGNSMSFFDVFVLWLMWVVVTDTHNYWWFLALVPCVLLSAHMNIKLKERE